MREPNKAEVNQLAAFLRQQEQPLLKTQSKKLRSWLSEHFDCQPVHNGLLFNARQKRLLRQELDSLFPQINWLAGIQGQQSRTQIVSQLNDDKQADISPNQGWLLVKPAQHWAACGLTAPLPETCALRLPVADVALAQLPGLLIIENLDIFDQWSASQHQGKLGQLLAVYRGNEKSTVQGVLQLLSKKEQIAAYFGDFDPKGLEIAHTLPGITHLLVPALSQLPLMQRHSQPLRFLHQQGAVSFLNNQPTSGWQPWIDALLNKQLMLVQQQILSKGFPLELVSKSQ